MSTSVTEDYCASCKRPISETLSGKTTAHWNGPFGTIIVDWTCGGSCAAAYEYKRYAERFNRGEVVTFTDRQGETRTRRIAARRALRAHDNPKLIINHLYRLEGEKTYILGADELTLAGATA